MDPDTVVDRERAFDNELSNGMRFDVPFDAVPPGLHETDEVIDQAFQTELRERNLPMLLWTAVVFNIAYVAWTVFDVVLVADQWSSFFVFRLAAVLINTVMVAVIFRPRFRKYSLEGFWLLVFVYCGFIAPMLPLVGDDLSKYVIGLSVTMIGAGVIPVWHPRWPLSVLLLSLVVNAAFFFPFWSGEPPAREVVANIFVVITATGLAVVAAIFKYDLAKRDFLSRAQLAQVAKRESEARLILAQTSDDLQGALEKLKELDRLKSKFFANISHELRTPLTLILAPVSELGDTVTTDDARRQVRVIRRNAERLLGLINDLLDLSSLDAGGLRLNLAEMDIRSVAASVHENSAPAAMVAGIDLILSTDTPTEKIWGDAHRLEIVLTNLVSNAIKFTPPGGRIEIRVQDLEDGVRLEVQDTGPGIPDDDLPRVFERFFQVSPGDRRREGGVGIGLALAKELIDLHGGTISVTSPEGGGASFTVFIPFGSGHIRPEVIERRQHFEKAQARRRAGDPPAIEATAPPIAPEDLAAEPPGDDGFDPSDALIFDGGRRPRVLIAEDNPEVRDFIKTLLDPAFEVILAIDGAEALKLIRSDAPDLVVSDVMMPNMSGTELCRIVKNTPVLRSTPVILLTARVGSEATLEAYAHGADDFVAKPFHPRVLMARIRAQLKLRMLGLQLAQQERMAAVGTLSAGILHEVRNPVNAILNASRAMANARLDENTRHKLLDVIAEGAVRIQEITAALDSHARPAEAGQTTSCDLREGLDATLRLLRYQLDGVAVHRNYTTDRLAMAPAGPMNQVLLNLIDNAVRMGAGTLWVGVRDGGDTLVAEIADDGPGVAREDAERIFDPFFTRRPSGDGTGLGLFLSRRMVEESGGSLQVGDREGGGALFIMEVPAVPLKGETVPEPGAEPA